MFKRAIWWLVAGLLIASVGGRDVWAQDKPGFLIPDQTLVQLQTQADALTAKIQAKTDAFNKKRTVETDAFNKKLLPDEELLLGMRVLKSSTLQDPKYKGYTWDEQNKIFVLNQPPVPPPQPVGTKPGQVPPTNTPATEEKK